MQEGWSTISPTNEVSSSDPKERQVKDEAANPLLPVRNVATRWNSQIMNAERLLLLRLTILAVGFNSSVTKPADSSRLRLFETIWKVLDDIVPVLRPLAAATQLLTAEKTPTIS